jgi:hypothetical protein
LLPVYRNMSLVTQVEHHVLCHLICSANWYGSSVMLYFIKISLIGCVWKVFLWTKTIYLQYPTKYVLCHGRNVTESFVQNVEEGHVKTAHSIMAKSQHRQYWIQTEYQTMWDGEYMGLPHLWQFNNTQSKTLYNEPIS